MIALQFPGQRARAKLGSAVMCLSCAAPCLEHDVIRTPFPPRALRSRPKAARHSTTIFPGGPHQRRKCRPLPAQRGGFGCPTVEKRAYGVDNGFPSVQRHASGRAIRMEPREAFCPCPRDAAVVLDDGGAFLEIGRCCLWAPFGPFGQFGQYGRNSRPPANSAQFAHSAQRAGPPRRGASETTAPYHTSRNRSGLTDQVSGLRPCPRCFGGSHPSGFGQPRKRCRPHRGCP